jgi:hypothetical protein
MRAIPKLSYPHHFLDKPLATAVIEYIYIHTHTLCACVCLIVAILVSLLLATAIQTDRVK